MFFSVIVPVYNVEKYLQQCLDSLVNQTSTDREIILIDDGSTDSSGAICDEYAQNYDDVTVIHQANQGLSGARNTGLEHAKGEWLSFIDSDDWVETDMLERVQGYILATNADAYQFNIKASNEQGTVEKEERFVETACFFSLPDEQTLFHFYHSYLPIVGSVWRRIYRHSIIREHNLRFIDEKGIYAEDKLFNFQYVLHIRSMMFINDILYHYRVRNDSLIRSTSSEDKLLRVFPLTKYAYQSVVDNRMTYFQQNFHHLYFKIINPYATVRAMDIPDTQIRAVIDKACEQDFHRHYIQALRKQGNKYKHLTNGRVWFSKSFGRREKSQTEWRLWLFRENIKYTLRHELIVGLNYYRDEEQQVAYLVIPKAACSSVRVSMLRRSDIPDDQSVHRIKNNRRQQQPFRDKGWFIFSFVRNPFARLVSCYESKYHDDMTRNIRAFAQGFFDFDRYLKGFMREDKGFAHFIKQVTSIPYRLANPHFRSQYRMLVDKDGKPMVDFIGKVERMEEDYEPIRQKYGFDPLPHYNKMEYGDWRDYYTTTLAKKVYRKFKKDILYFGYEQEYRDLLEYCAKKEGKISPP